MVVVVEWNSLWNRVKVTLCWWDGHFWLIGPRTSEARHSLHNCPTAMKPTSNESLELLLSVDVKIVTVPLPEVVEWVNLWNKVWDFADGMATFDSIGRRTSEACRLLHNCPTAMKPTSKESLELLLSVDVKIVIVP